MKKYNPTLRALTKILNDLRYHDGNALGVHLGISRNAVWKSMQKLADYGVQFNSHPKLGYQLQCPLMLIEQQPLKNACHQLGINAEVFDSVSSTNDLLKNMSSNKAKHCVVAEQQTAGRGRLQRSWFSPFGMNVYLSLRYYCPRDVSELSGLSLALSIAVLNALKDLVPAGDFKLKWPNDIVTYTRHDHQWQKVAGLLIELEAESHGSCAIVIGIGVNANMSQEKALPIDQPWEALCHLHETLIDRTELCLALCRRVDNALAKFTAEGFTMFAEQWGQLDALANQPITLRCGQSIIHGKARGINALGQLQLIDDQGIMRCYASGEVQQVRPLASSGC